MNTEEYTASLIEALAEAFAIYEDAGCGAVRFDGYGFTAHAYTTQGLIDTEALAEFINYSAIPVWNTEALAEEYAECYKWDIFKKVGIAVA